MEDSNSEIPCSQKEVKRPIFSESVLNTNEESSTSIPTCDGSVKQLKFLSDVKFNYNTIMEGLNLAKKSKALPPYMNITVNFTPRMLQHQTKDGVKDQVRELNARIKTEVLSSLSGITAKAITEVGKEMDSIVQEVDEQFIKGEKFEERNRFFKTANEIKEEYATKLAKYKESLPRKQTFSSGFKAKDRYRKF
ncbi:unnamed protein product [Mytilus coruscus]|uniref:Uncharacterized protein n=1 Tax=Mytilus coruscus TaxID=42192 RepID=A0A6J8D4V2_MYTCO|nr:unnamed protein product [Mytilus coruscus]